ncbi:hypothetical protein WJX72_007532 [[Myrmecia] bisecta]|uniref:Proteasome subunit beta n=1 Tax=[Myrmecia] bisecta TaxID=41462 RepID=A0AAW1Q4B1_9CHLO
MEPPTHCRAGATLPSGQEFLQSFQHRIARAFAGDTFEPIPLRCQMAGAGVQQPHAGAQAGPRVHANWSPYDDNGGTCVAVAGNDYCIIAASTRMSSGYAILTRRSSKFLKFSDKCLIASAGFQADLLGNTLYYKRFFPYYAWNLCAGLDEEGKGAVYTYDPVGSFERVGYSCQGSGKDLIQPVLDNQLRAASPLLLPAKNWMSSLPLDQAVDLVKDAFVSAGERDIYTGDWVELLIVTKGGIRREELELKKD